MNRLLSLILFLASRYILSLTSSDLVVSSSSCQLVKLGVAVEVPLGSVGVGLPEVLYTWLHPRLQGIEGQLRLVETSLVDDWLVPYRHATSTTFSRDGWSVVRYTVPSLQLLGYFSSLAPNGHRQELPRRH